MNLVGVLLLGLAASAAFPARPQVDLAALRRRTRWGAALVQWVPQRNAPYRERWPHLRLRLGLAAACCLPLLVAALAQPGALLLVPLTAWGCWMLPARLAARKRAAGTAAALGAIPEFLVGWRALLAAGMVPVRALDAVARSGESTAALAAREGLARYALGVPWAEAVGRAWREAGLWPLAWLATALADAEARGRRSLEVVAEQEHRLRQAQRVEALERAHAVSGRFVLVLTLTYLPAFMVGVLVPLFIAVMTRAFQ